MIEAGAFHALALRADGVPGRWRAQFPVQRSIAAGDGFHPRRVAGSARGGSRLTRAKALRVSGAGQRATGSEPPLG